MLRQHNVRSVGVHVKVLGRGAVAEVWTLETASMEELNN